MTTLDKLADLSVGLDVVAGGVNALTCTIKSITARSVCWVTDSICFFKTGIKWTAPAANASHACWCAFRLTSSLASLSREASLDRFGTP